MAESVWLQYISSAFDWNNSTCQPFLTPNWHLWQMVQMSAQCLLCKTEKAQISEKNADYLQRLASLHSAHWSIWLLFSRIVDAFNTNGSVLVLNCNFFFIIHFCRILSVLQAQENSEFCTNSENLSSLAVLEWLSGRQGCTWKRYINILTLLHSSFAPSMLRVSSQHPCALVNLVYIVCSSFCFICAKYPSYKLQKNNHRN